MNTSNPFNSVPSDAAYVAELASIVQIAEERYRAGLPTAYTDKHFDEMKALLRKLDPNHPFFEVSTKGRILLSLANHSFAEWWNGLPDDVDAFLLQPKIDGCAVALRYVDGLLQKAWNRKGVDKTYCMRKIENIPLCLPIDGVVEIRGELYGTGGVSPESSQRLAAGHLRKKAPTGKGLAFCAFDILKGNGLEDLDEDDKVFQLEAWGFQSPQSFVIESCGDETIFEVKALFDKWEDARIFASVPTDGCVVKVLDRSAQKALGETTIAPNWAIALKEWKEMY